MSAIWGMIDLTGKPVEKDRFKRMKEAFLHSKIDRVDEMIEGNVALGCGHQYFTKRAVREHLPLLQDQICFTADAVLDNREELIATLYQSPQNPDRLTDGQILSDLVSRKGVEGLDLALGVFTFAQYQRAENKLYLGTDALGNRTVYYYVSNHIVYFSTLLEAITRVNRIRINDRWFHDFILIDNLSMHSGESETPYEGVYLVPSASVITFDKDHMEETRYWKPYERIKEQNVSDEECRERTIQLFTDAVHRTLQSRDDTAILLSGGLDSTSVACFAARELKKENKKLYSFTSVPEEGFQSRKNRYFLPDETEQVNITADYLGNVETHFMKMQGMNCWDAGLSEIRHYEMPYKSTQNLIWMTKGLEEARKCGCSIMLTGQFGNATISYGDYFAYCNSLLCAGKIVDMIREVNQIQKKYHVSRKNFYRELCGAHLHHFSNTGRYMYNECSNENLEKELNSRKRLKKLCDTSIVRNLTFEKNRLFLVNRIALRQIGEAETKMSLATGVLFRDPTRDKRLIEYVLTLKADQFDREGESRRLVTCYLRDFLPDKVIACSENHKGKQSADMQLKLKKEWPRICGEMERIYRSETAKRYLNVPVVLKELHQMEDDVVHVEPFAVMRMIYMAWAIRFITDYNHEKGFSCTDHTSKTVQSNHTFTAIKQS